MSGTKKMKCDVQPCPGEEKSILIRCTRTGKDAFEAVYNATLSEWTRLTGLTEEETFLAVDCDELLDEELFDQITQREEVDVRLSELDDIPFVINCF